jgi:hypothetical protein
MTRRPAVHYGVSFALSLLTFAASYEPFVWLLIRYQTWRLGHPNPFAFGSSCRCSVVFLVGCGNCVFGGREESQTSTDGGSAVTLWHLLLAMCLVMPATGAVVSARLVNAGFVGYALVITLGLALGVGCA